MFMTRLQQHWQSILDSFFPTWKAGKQWRCTTKTRRTAHGYCNTDRRVIEIGLVASDDDELDRLLIHEISHATVPGGHTKKWQHRMSRAAVKARKLARHRLAQLLDEEVKNYQESAFTMAHAYQQVEDALADNPDLTLAQIKRWLAQEFGLLVIEVDQRFRRLQQVYDHARIEALQARQARSKWTEQGWGNEPQGQRQAE
jgi:hypothetical protein